MLNASNHSKLIAGMVDQGVEFFVDQNEVKCIHNGRVYSYGEFPEWIMEAVQENMLKYPEAIKALAQWENLHESDYIRQYIYCRFGGLDFDPDIDKDRRFSFAEYFDCGLRGKCKYEGKLCCTIKVADGHLTRTEMEVLRRIDEPDKLIADAMNISIETVNSHLQNIRRKTGFKNKPQMAIFAAQKGIFKS